MDDAIGYFRGNASTQSGLLDRSGESGECLPPAKALGRSADDAGASSSGAAEDPEANYSLAMVFAQTGRYGARGRVSATRFDPSPGLSGSAEQSGCAVSANPPRAEAVAKFEESIRVAPGFDQSYLNLARVYTAQGDREKARAVLLDLLKQHPGHPQAQQMLDQLR